LGGDVSNCDAKIRSPPVLQIRIKLRLRQPRTHKLLSKEHAFQSKHLGEHVTLIKLNQFSDHCWGVIVTVKVRCCDAYLQFQLPEEHYIDLNQYWIRRNTLFRNW